MECPSEIWERESTLYLWAHEIENILDIGSGLGVWPAVINEYNNFDITCIEPNKDSLQLIKDLGFECYDSLDKINYNYDLATIIHVLEHIDDVDAFLRAVPAERLFIEVPDSFEFEYLPKGHDEFNSCHVHFFNVAGLMTVLERNDYFPTEVRRVKYPDRNLMRIMVYATEKPRSTYREHE
jgi:SAM-dependent methyltransferase